MTKRSTLEVELVITIIVRYHVARDGEIRGEWTATELYPLLRDNVFRPRDYYWIEGMTDWAPLADLPCGKKYLATEAQREMMARNGINFDNLTSKAEVSQLMEEMLHSRPASEKQREFIAEVGLSCPNSFSLGQARELIESELARETPDGPASEYQLNLLRTLGASAERGLSRRDAACDIKIYREDRRH